MGLDVGGDLSVRQNVELDVGGYNPQFRLQTRANVRWTEPSPIYMIDDTN